jgi:hypothetical protein
MQGMKKSKVGMWERLFRAWILRIRAVSLSVFLALVLAGCANIRVTDPARTATEQFLLSQAAVKAVEPLSFDALQERRVYLNPTYFSPEEKEFVLAEFRAKLLLSGVQITDEKEEAEIILELRSGGVGIDRYESLFGIPAITAPSGASATATGAPVATLVTPELAITKKIEQVSFASVAYVAYWADTGEVITSFGPSVGSTYREDWWILGFGPQTVGNIPTVNRRFE